MSEHLMLKTGSGDNFLSPDADVDELDFTAKPSRTLEITIAAIALTLSALAYYLAYNIELRFDPGGINARWWPELLSLIAIGLSGLLLVASLTVSEISRGDVEESNADGWSRMLKALALTSIYVFAWAIVGYVIPTVIYLAVLLWIFGLRSKVGLIAFPVITTGFIYLLFHYMLRVPL